MADLKQFKLPDVGEGLTEADILTGRSQPGDAVVVNQMLVEVETAKAAVELPSPYAGVVTALHVAEGDTVDVGRPIITIDVDPDGSTANPPTPRIVSAGEESDPTLAAHDRADRRDRRVRGPPADARRLRTARRGRRAPAARAATVRPDAVPHVDTHVDDARRCRAGCRRAARGPGQAAGPQAGQDPRRRPGRRSPRPARTARSRAPTCRRRPTDRPPAAAPRSPGRRVRRRETRIPIKGVRKHTAAAMVASAFTAPHVTEFMTVDVTATMELRDRIAAPTGIPRREGVAAAVRRPGGPARRAAHARDQLDLGRGRRRDRPQALREPRHRGRDRSRPDRAQHQGRRPACRCSSWPTRSAR